MQESSVPIHRSEPDRAGIEIAQSPRGGLSGDRQMGTLGSLATRVKRRLRRLALGSRTVDCPICHTGRGPRAQRRQPCLSLNLSR